ncbi:hypothetical protein [Caloranaerobacter ferrireducens]|uniref:hypothetical protein n=1 Tax=Caloranaerobacter ferrireducens TaxID=1323370 RepID=UPI00114CEEF7|nr:hypothetical protein [Caloranaerobacter ferrireducens]
MVSRKVIPVSINDDKVLEYLETKENKSQYIRELIRKDMTSNKGLSDEMKKLILDFIKQNYSNISINTNDDLINFKDEINEIFDLK